MTAQEAWAYLKPLIKPDGWGQDGPYDTNEKMEAIITIEELLFRMEGLEL